MVSLLRNSRRKRIVRPPSTQAERQLAEIIGVSLRRNGARFDTPDADCYVRRKFMSETTHTEADVVTLTESAAKQIKEMLTNPENAGKNLRVYVEGGGCSGLQYGMVFDEKRADDVVTDFFGVSVLVDPFSANYLHGANIDFSDALTGGGFKISNPNARQSCGCGKSFEA
jgi:iron-sulfur cluster assembly accessory protein